MERLTDSPARLPRLTDPAMPRRSESAPVRPLPVLFVIDSLDGGGAERYVVDLACALRRRGWPVEVACSTGGVRAGALREADVPVHVLCKALVKRRISVTYGHALRSLLRTRRFAVVHAHLYASAVASVQATAGTAVPVMLTEHTEAPWRGRSARSISRVVYRRAARIVAVSTAIQRLLVDEYGVARDRVQVLLPAVTGTGSPTPKVAHRPELVVGLVARLVPEKGGHVFLEAASLVRAVVPQARFVVVGDGPLGDALEQHAATLGVRDVVAFLGFRSDAARLMSGFDVLAVPSLSDGTPLVVLEAMASGVPVVASATGGLPDLVSPSENGILVQPGDPEDLARALVAVLLDPAGARQLGARGQRLVRAYPHSRLVDRMIQLYRAVATEPRRSGATGLSP
jgi:glycosyltransferase involved in cell wall biosynthesis